MPMQNPPHPGPPISAAAKALGVTRQRPHDLVSGRSGIAPEMAIRLQSS